MTAKTTAQVRVILALPCLRGSETDVSDVALHPNERHDKDQQHESAQRQRNRDAGRIGLEVGHLIGQRLSKPAVVRSRPCCPAGRESKLTWPTRLPHPRFKAAAPTAFPAPPDVLLPPPSRASVAFLSAAPDNFEMGVPVLAVANFLTAIVTPVLMPAPVTAEPVIPRIQEMAS